jgi:hypothetical protein
VQVQSRRFNGPCVEITIKFDNITGQDPRDAEQRVAIAMGNVTRMSDCHDSPLGSWRNK